MAKRKLLKDQDRRKLFDIPVDEDSFIRHYLLSSADRLQIERKHPSSHAVSALADENQSVRVLRFRSKRGA